MTEEPKRPVATMQIPRELANTLDDIIKRHNELGFRNRTELAVFILRDWVEGMIRKDITDTFRRKMDLQQQFVFMVESMEIMSDLPKRVDDKIVNAIIEEFKVNKTINTVRNIGKNFSQGEQRFILPALALLIKEGDVRLNDNLTWEYLR